MPSLKLLNDLAIKEEENSRTDGLGFETYAQVLGNAALGTQGPFTIGIFGEWGTGKTSLMHLMQSYLNKNNNIITVWFNAWRYEKEEHPIIPLLATIIRELQLNQTFTQNLTNQGRELLNALRAVAYGFSTKSSLTIPGLAEIEASFVAKEMVDRAECLSNDPLIGRSLYYEAFERLSATKIGGEKKIIVFIDDLDRCFPDLAIKLLESMKLVLNQPGFIFVLGVARTVIKGYLQYLFLKKYGLENFDGESYLDKIIQLPFHIPPHIDRINTFCESILQQLDPSDKRVFKSILPTIANTTNGNPRATIRFVNNLLIDRAINLSLSEKREMESVPIEYFAVTRILQQRWSNIFSLITTLPELVKEASTWKQEDLSGYTQSKIEGISTLATSLKTDRFLSDLLFSNHGQSWLKNENISKSTITFIKQRTQEAEGYREQREQNYNLFIFFDRDDSESVDIIIEQLIEQGISISYNQDSYNSRINWQIEVENALHNSKGILICFGKNLEFSNILKNNFLYHLILRRPFGFHIVPILLPGSNLKEIPTPLKKFIWINLRDGMSKLKIKQIVDLVSPK